MRPGSEDVKKLLDVIDGLPSLLVVRAGEVGSDIEVA